ncbi:hypothetical protein EXN65_14695 [Clostridium botulinum]|uniref:hypothetical protein n=1 Tax=Clostridium botulinum TaxID=1491 RepID=UPI000EE89E30|nr:hypothetical protein [Clostridium botulinum]NEZ85915.1 hypothetical protein [Clostridium botulinum]NFE31693.1 hypothetical protein [Clostridium botulinum]RFM18498.1 hypothetical protein C1147_18350 [Clostridium botulinum]WCJ71955.1 hypothetical protein MHB86_002296 [Clostridium botulinum]WCJ75794.1 hypothetical protein MHI66_002296 [Clostridium botulinum]
MENKFIIQKIKKLSFFSNEDTVRYELYSILSSLILSEEIFKSNKEVNIFLKELGIENKEYIIKNRAAMLAKTLRIINKKNMYDLRLFQNKLLNIYEKYIACNEKVQDDNYVKNILKKYSRDDLNE